MTSSIGKLGVGNKKSLKHCCGLFLLMVETWHTTPQFCRIAGWSVAGPRNVIFAVFTNYISFISHIVSQNLGWRNDPFWDLPTHV